MAAEKQVGLFLLSKTITHGRGAEHYLQQILVTFVKACGIPRGQLSGSP